MNYINEKKDSVNYIKRPGAYAIITRKEDEKIAIVSSENKFFFLGGGIENEENPLDTLKRELIEESGYRIKNVEEFDKIGSYEFSTKRGYLDIIANVFLAEFDKKVAVPIEKDHSVIWVNPKEYVDKLHFNWHRYILKKYIDLKN